MKDKLLPEDCPAVGVIIGWAIAEASPNKTQAILGGTIGNIIGHIPDDIWEQMKTEALKPCLCGDPDCDPMHKQIYAALDVLRKKWQQVTNPSTSDEKGFSE